MASLHQRNDPVRLLWRRLLILGLFVLALLASSGVWSAYQKERASRALRLQAQGQLSDLSQREHQLNADIAKLETNRGKEEALREQYELAAEGEGLIIIVDQNQEMPVEAPSSLTTWFKNIFTWW